MRKLTLVPLLIVLGAAGCSSDEGEATASSEMRSPAPADPAAPPATGSAVRGVRLLKVGDFDAPTFITSPPGDRTRRFVTERSGRVIVLRRGRRATFLDIRSRVDTAGEGGLLSIAFAPDYRRSGRYYVYYVGNDGSLVVDGFRRSRRNAQRTARGSRRNVITTAHRNANHKGGQLQFGRDRRLYIGFGDGGGGGDPEENAQDLSKLLGKLLRVTPKAGGGYSIPRDNPFVGRSGARGEIFAYGLRNPYRFSFDRRNGNLALADVGQDAVEEVDFLRASKRAKRPRGGANFGWDVFEGTRRFEDGSAPAHVPPVLERTHDRGFCSITGGYVIRDRSMGRFRGAYVYGDLCDPKLRIARLRAGGARGDRALGPRVPTLVSFGEDARGRVYAVSLEGPVYRLAPRR